MDLNILSDKVIIALKKKAAEILPPGSTLSLYGSRARGDAREDSDWDIHILMPGQEHLPLALYDKYAWPLERIGYEFNETINARFYSYEGWAKRRFLPFYKNVENDKIILYQN